MTDLLDISGNLRLADGGLWVATDSRPVSFPADGHRRFFEVEDRSFWFRHRNAVLRAVLASHPPDGALFDIGGGNGCVARALEDVGVATVVVEPGAEGAQHAMGRGLTVVNASLEDAGFRDGSVPALGLFDVLEHLEDDAGLLRRLHRALAPGGRLYVTVPTYAWLWSGEDAVAGHYRRYTRRELAARLAEAGFAVERASYFFAALVPLVAGLRALPHRLGCDPPVNPTTTGRAHAGRENLAGRLLERALSWETGWLRAGRRIPFGTSCLAVAQKPASAGTA